MEDCVEKDAGMFVLSKKEHLDELVMSAIGMWGESNFVYSIFAWVWSRYSFIVGVLILQRRKNFFLYPVKFSDKGLWI